MASSTRRQTKSMRATVSAGYGGPVLAEAAGHLVQLRVGKRIWLAITFENGEFCLNGSGQMRITPNVSNDIRLKVSP